MPPKRRSSGALPTDEQQLKDIGELEHELKEVKKHRQAGEQHEPSEELRFYRATGRYSFLSNFSKHTLTLGKTPYRTSEHAYQAMKARNPNDAEMIRLANTPMGAKKLGQKVDLRVAAGRVVLRAGDEGFRDRADVLLELRAQRRRVVPGP